MNILAAYEKAFDSDVVVGKILESKFCGFANYKKLPPSGMEHEIVKPYV